jgi:hypothetical protein
MPFRAAKLTLRLHAPTSLATFRQKKLEVAREKTMPINIRNLATLPALAACCCNRRGSRLGAKQIRSGGERYRDHRTTGTGSISSARDSDGVTAIYPAKSFHPGSEARDCWRKRFTKAIEQSKNSSSALTL